ncbi:hypothetical protein RFI_08701 [Reticulomyxa filosa]|uniref:Uncharacterized protein n=1 Tax=Reticulomyxa filosa TaxID=46433 RepID=X6NR16_RETFI|nr:hypothetical protein RFI_08701 [Reticulomyxa filosa]|eukprot:ETO28431.1 hypothetical protein RFI_08701 [Reticulomyxa filosa]
MKFYSIQLGFQKIHQKHTFIDFGKLKKSKGRQKQKEKVKLVKKYNIKRSVPALDKKITIKMQKFEQMTFVWVYYFNDIISKFFLIYLKMDLHRKIFSLWSICCVLFIWQNNSNMECRIRKEVSTLTKFFAVKYFLDVQMLASYKATFFEFQNNCFQFSVICSSKKTLLIFEYKKSKKKFNITIQNKNKHLNIFIKKFVAQKCKFNTFLNQYKIKNFKIQSRHFNILYINVVIKEKIYDCALTYNALIND